MIDISFYGSVEEADSYFGNRLHGEDWLGMEAGDKSKTLYAATQIMDALNFKGVKTSEDQSLEFPRDGNTETPEDIRIACYEIAYSLYQGKDPELELESLAVTSRKFGLISTSYDRDKIPVEHIINGIPSATAWRYLKPYLNDDQAIKLNRVS